MYAVNFQEPVHLFSSRNFAEIIALRHPDKLSPEVCAWLKTAEAHNLLHEASGRPCKREVGYDEKRNEVFSGTILQPETVVLTFSAQETLEKTINALKRTNLAHNFLIDRDGKIYPVTNSGETIEQSLEHRAHSVGQSALVVDGFYHQRDMNSRSISISVVGKDTELSTSEQDQALVVLLDYLVQKYNIRPDQVLDYGCVAYPYGRRNTQLKLPWELLAQKKLVLWPKLEHMQNVSFDFKSSDLAAQWTSAALLKIGFVCPCTYDQGNPHFVSALKAFQQHYKCDNQDGNITGDTVMRINSILIQHEQLNDKLKNIMPLPLPPTRVLGGAL